MVNKLFCLLHKYLLLNTHEQQGINDHIVSYINYYSKLTYEPKFSVLLNGAWGVGKTALINRIKNHCLPKRGYIYVSLYGLSSIEAVNDALLFSMYPILSSKAFRVIGRLASVAAKKFNIGGAVTSNDLNRMRMVNIYIFDDLERCELPIKVIFGYINYLVEHDGRKVIIVTDENKIKDSEAYKDYREKIVGMSFEVKPQVKDAVRSFIEKTESRRARAFFDNNLSNIIDVFTQSKTSNLRILLHAMRDLERVYDALSDTHRDNGDVTTILLKMFLAISMEFKLNLINVKTMESRSISDFSLTISSSRNSGATPSAGDIKYLKEKYPGVEITNTMISDNVLINIITKGIVDGAKIRSEIDKSHYFIPRNTEAAWRTVWHWSRRTESEFNDSKLEMERQFSNREFVEFGEILHVIGLRLWLAKIGELNERSTILAECINYIDDLYKSNRLEPFPLEDVITNRDDIIDGFDGLGFVEREAQDFIKARQHLIKMRNKATSDKYPLYARELLDDLQRDPKLYYRKLCNTAEGGAIFYKIPILSFIDVNDFVKSLLNQTPEHQYTILLVFRSRYEFGPLDRELLPEKDWLISLRKAIIDCTDDMTPIGRYRTMQLLSAYVDPFIPQVATIEANDRRDS